MDKFSILSLMFWTLQCGLIHETLADCTEEELSIHQGSTQSPRDGIHYVVVPKSDYFIDDPQTNCPSGSSLTYIKSQEEWEDWKFLRGMSKCLKHRPVKI